MDQLMSSLLVWQDGQLMPASSASSLHRDDDPLVSATVCLADGGREDVAYDVARVVGPAGGNTPVGGTTATSDIMAPVENSFRIKDTRKTNSVAARPPAKRAHVEGDDDERVELKRQNSTSLPCTAHATVQSKLNSSIAHRSSTATEAQRLKATIEAFGIEKLPPSNQFTEPEMELDLPDRSVGGFANLPPMPMAASDIMTIEEFEMQYPYSPPLLKNGLPPRTVNPIRLDVNNGVHTAALHAACQERGLIPRIETPQVAEGCFKAILIIDNQIVEQLTNVYASKKDAKEELCRRALPTVSALENKKKGKTIEPGDGCATPPDDLDEEEWMGILQHYAQSTKCSRPVVKTQGVHPLNGPWLSAVQLPDDSLALFGSESGPFRTKKVAEKVAAREAVLWLRAQGKIDPKAYFHNPAKDNKRRKSSNPAQVSGPGETGLTQTLLPALNLNLADPLLKDESPGRLVHLLTDSLGLQNPTIHHAQIEGSSFVDTWAEFDLRSTRTEPRLAGQVGKVERIFGKKVGKEMCMREVLRVLDEIRQTRIANC